MKKHLFAILYAVFLASFSAYILLDTFIIPRTYQLTEVSSDQTDFSGKSSAMASDSKNATDITHSGSAWGNGSTQASTSTKTTDKTADAIITENSYQDSQLTIKIRTVRQYNTQIYVADVKIKNAALLKTAFAQHAYGRNLTQTTSQIAIENQAIVAINGDFYGARTAGYVIRNGVLYRDASCGAGQEDLVIDADGSAQIIREGDISAAELVAKNTQQVLSFGPGLIENGNICVDSTDEVGQAMVSNPRTAIGVIAPLHYLFVVSDGRTSESSGLSLLQMAQFLKSLGAKTAYNLDGGGSSTFWFNGRVVNHPTTNGNHIQERKVSDIVYFGL